MRPIERQRRVAAGGSIPEGQDVVGEVACPLEVPAGRFAQQISVVDRYLPRLDELAVASPAAIDGPFDPRDAVPMRLSIPLSFASLVLVVGCNGSDKLTTGSLTATADGGVVALIRVSASTNSAEVDVTVYTDSATRTIGPARGSLDGTPAMFLPGQPAVENFLADLDAVGNVAAIPIGQCAKSVSFGTITTVAAGGTTSGDLQCLSNPTAAATRLAADCNTLATGTPQETFDGG